MKFLLISSALFVSVNAAVTTFTQTYPTINKVPDVTSAQVKQWVAEINMTAVPNFAVIPAKNGSPGMPTKDLGSCDWTYNQCTRSTDIVACPTGYWGLTYDDGPTQFSPTLYDTLLKTNQKATMFWIGSNVYTSPTIAQRACAEGHHIAVHTWSHQPSTSLTNQQFIAEVKWTETIIKEVCGITPRYFRPPYGDIDDRIRGLLTQMGYTPVIWDIDTNDWEMPPGGSRTAAQIDAQFTTWIADNKKNQTGHICLEHDLYQNSVNEAIKQLPNIQANWKAMAVASCVNDPHPYKEQNITFPTIANGMSNVSAPASSSVNPSSSVPSSALPTGSNISAAANSTSNVTGTTAAPTTKASSASSVTAPLAASLAFMIASIFLAL